MTLPNAEFVIPGERQETLLYAANHWVSLCRESIQDHDFFAVALSGGSTPIAIYELLTSGDESLEIEWNKVLLFWGDERKVPHTHTDSNYKNSMEAGFKNVCIPENHIYPIPTSQNITDCALAYEKTIRTTLKDRSFDLVMLGVGEDGHTASLFPNARTIFSLGHLVIPAEGPKQERITLSLEAINDSAHVVLYVLGESKQAIVKKAFHSQPHLPCQLVGTEEKKALWILDQKAGALL